MTPVSRGARWSCKSPEKTSRGGWRLLPRVIQTKRPLVLDLNVFDRMQSIPQRKTTRDDQADQNTDSKEEPVGRKLDQQKGDHRDRDDQASSAF